jgi:5-methylcytosine-specific restriction endonuclease McrBC GTP-binding regulatory subunit McrB
MNGFFHTVKSDLLYNINIHFVDFIQKSFTAVQYFFVDFIECSFIARTVIPQSV